MNQEIMEPTVGYGEVEMLNKKGMAHLLARTAFRQFEKTPRRKARAGLNLLLSRAKEKGYPDKEAFLRVFKATREDVCAQRSVLKTLDEYITGDDILVVFQYLGGVS